MNTGVLQLAQQFAEQLEIIKLARQQSFATEAEEKQLKHILKLIADINLKGLDTDEARIVFWLNIYNSFIRYLILVGNYSGDLRRRSWIFFWPTLEVGKYHFSLDDIEHGILRGNRPAPYQIFSRFWSWDPRNKFAVKELDTRIHFALDKVVNSAPTAKVYELSKIQKQLDVAEYTFSKENFRVDIGQKSIEMNAIYDWYRDDFINSYVNDPTYRNFRVSIANFDWRIRA